MTSPTGPDQNHPQQGGPQQGQPGWSPPPPPGYPPQGYEAPSYDPQGYSPQGYDAPGYGSQGYGPAPSYAGGPAPTGRRPGQVTAAAIVGITWGTLGTLLSFVLMLGAFALGAGLVGLVLLVSTALYAGLIIAGVQTLQGRSPRLLLLLSYVAIGLSLLSLVVTFISTGGEVFSSVLGILVPGAVVFLLRQPQARQYYASRGISY